MCNGKCKNCKYLNLNEKENDEKYLCDFWEMETDLEDECEFFTEEE